MWRSWYVVAAGRAHLAAVTMVLSGWRTICTTRPTSGGELLIAGKCVLNLRRVCGE